MFKKKSNLPPRPKYPPTDQIIEDLSNATHDDPLFVTSKTITDKKLKSDTTQEHDEVYQKIKKFLNHHEDLQEVMKNLDAMQTILKEKEDEVVRLSDELKEKTLKAIA